MAAPVSFRNSPSGYSCCFPLPVLFSISFRCCFLYPGTHLSSHTVSSIVFSAAYGLTIVFGMGTGVSRKRINTGNLFSFFSRSSHFFSETFITEQYILPFPYFFFLRKEVIQPHLPIRLPCYDFTPVTGSTFDGSILSVWSPASGISDSHGVTGGVYKTRERIHRSILICDY